MVKLCRGASEYGSWQGRRPWQVAPPSLRVTSGIEGPATFVAPTLRVRTTQLAVPPGTGAFFTPGPRKILALVF